MNVAFRRSSTIVKRTSPIVTRIFRIQIDSVRIEKDISVRIEKDVSMIVGSSIFQSVLRSSQTFQFRVEWSVVVFFFLSGQSEDLSRALIFGIQRSDVIHVLATVCTSACSWCY